MPEDTPAPAFPLTQENTPEGLRGVLDYRLAEWSEGRAVVEMRVDGRHLNRSGVLHGGVIATLLDASCGYAATWSGDPAKPKAAVTLSLTVSYTGQVKEGVVRATALMKAGGARSFSARARYATRQATSSAWAKGASVSAPEASGTGPSPRPEDGPGRAAGPDAAAWRGRSGLAPARWIGRLGPVGVDRSNRRGHC
ncbi:PaaI family thioesterase [Haematobacter missouriensis]|uniref:PaaI family thioesterase n=1 Tax=Haematobacter missouriensis TaxID=366616 RepID=UPI0018E96DE5|nr:PaaI family thioesterase [Haematobacter missouriensis]